MKILKALILICTLLIVAPVAMAADSAPQFGKVAESIEAGAYVYIKLEEQGIWIAANNFPVSVGDSIQYSGGAEMRDFHSKTLERTFESVFFVQNAFVVGENEGKMRSAAADRKAAGMTTKPALAQAPELGEIKPLKEGKNHCRYICRICQLERPASESKCEGYKSQ